jgi:hypothetical protein
LARTFFWMAHFWMVQAGRLQSCVRPMNAALRPLALMGSAGRGLITSLNSKSCGPRRLLSTVGSTDWTIFESRPRKLSTLP